MSLDILYMLAKVDRCGLAPTQMVQSMQNMVAYELLVRNQMILRQWQTRHSALVKTKKKKAGTEC